jgi:hypothetical protein
MNLWKASDGDTVKAAQMSKRILGRPLSQRRIQELVKKYGLREPGGGGS